MISVNRRRGEVAARIDGKDYTLCLTLGALAELEDAFADAGVAYLKADWTNEDPLITRALADYGRSGVPLYLLYAPGEERARVLPQVLTKAIIIGELSTL